MRSFTTAVQTLVTMHLFYQVRIPRPDMPSDPVKSSAENYARGILGDWSWR